MILDPANYETWLHGDPDDAYALIEPYPAERMLVHQKGAGLKADRGGLYPIEE